MEKSNQSTFIIPVFIPHKGCPHRCVFCNQTTITGQSDSTLTPESLRRTIDEFLNFKTDNDITQISFYGGTFLGLGNREIEMCLSEAAKYVQEGKTDSIRFSTRPDSITREKMKLIKTYPVKTIEIGVQSMANDVLEKAGRGHTAEDTINAVRILKSEGYETGLQLMPGLPGDTENTMIATTKKIIQLKPDFVRIYPTIAFKGSGLEQMVSEGAYSPLSLDKSIDITKKMYLRFLKAGIPVIRMGLQSSVDFNESNEVIEGPYHPAFGHLVFSAIFLEMAFKALSTAPPEKTDLIIYVESRDISKMRGLKNSNIGVILDTFKLSTIKVKPDISLEKNTIKINGVLVDMISLCNKL